MMKKCLIVFIFAIGFLFSSAGMASANTIASSTMWFEGSLTESGGVYTGTIDAIAGTFYYPGGPGTHADSGQSSGYATPDGRNAVGGFDVYAKQGASAYYDDVFKGIVGSNHDAYSGPGGWGDFWNPDVPDWGSYQLTLTMDHWYLEFKNAALATPMSGPMNWGTMLATETDTGSYRGTVPIDPDANDGGAVALIGGSGAGYWDMDWTWGSEAIPLQWADFAVNITGNGNASGGYKVSLTPVPEPATMTLLGIGLVGLVGASARRRFKKKEAGKS